MASINNGRRRTLDYDGFMLYMSNGFAYFYIQTSRTNHTFSGISQNESILNSLSVTKSRFYINSASGNIVAHFRLFQIELLATGAHANFDEICDVKGSSVAGSSENVQLQSFFSVI